ncbi:hypothetical protein ACOMHN_058554 [Nucella lapillus]
MAMLAEPKRKQKYGPDPRNTFWSSDEDKFGFRMLENMGWKKGKGLGAKESGMTEHIKVDNRKTTNVRGFGCSKKDAERWIAHQDDFNSILASFNDSPDTSDASGKLAEDTNSSHALEEKSKSSRSRMHYHKFIRSKDLSSRSSHDLNCIFGRRKGKSSEDSTPAAQSEVNGDENSSSDDQTKNSNNNNNDDTHGVKTITSSTSVQEYFAMKMAELKRKRGATAGDGCLDKGDKNVDISTENNKDDNKDPDTADQAVNIESRSAADTSSVSAGEDCGVVEKPKRKKKKKKDRQEDEKNDVEQEAHLGEDSLELRASSAENCQESSSCVEQQPAKSKKKGKRKRKADSSKCGLDTSTQAISAEEPESEISQEVGPTTKKRNKRKSAEQSLSASEQEETCEVTNDVSEEHCEEPQRKKKKKKKKKKKQKKDETESHNSSILRHENDGKNRRRKSVQFSANEVEIFLIPNKEDEKAEQESEETVTQKLSKKRKRQKTQAAEETKSTNDETTAESTPGETEDPLKEDNNDDDDEPKKKKRKTEAKVSKKKSKTPKKEEDIQGESAENESPHSESADGGDDEVNTSNPESPASDRIPDAVASKPQKKVSRERLNGICKAFVGSSLSSVAGYGNVS